MLQLPAIYNHSSKCCFLNPVCLKCSGAYNVKKCKVMGKNGIKCANCGDNHTANFDCCPKNPKKLRNGRITIIRYSNQYFNAKPVNNTTPFSTVLKGNTSNLIGSPVVGSPENLQKSSTANNSNGSNVNISKSTTAIDLNVSHYSNALSFSHNVTSVNNVKFLLLIIICWLTANKLIANKSVSELLTFLSPDRLLGLKSSEKH